MYAIRCRRGTPSHHYSIQVTNFRGWTGQTLESSQSLDQPRAQNTLAKEIHRGHSAHSVSSLLILTILGIEYCHSELVIPFGS